MSYVIMLWLQKWRFHHHFFLELVVRNYIMYENVWKKIKIGKKVTWKINLVLKDAFSLSARQLSSSTTGIPGLKNT